MQALPHKHCRLVACAGNADSQARVGCGCDWVVINVHTVYTPCIVLVTVMTSTATVVNRTRYAERLRTTAREARWERPRPVTTQPQGISPAAGKVTVYLASHWPRVTYISGSPPTGSRPRRGR